MKKEEEKKENRLFILNTAFTLKIFEKFAGLCRNDSIRDIRNLPTST